MEPVSLALHSYPGLEFARIHCQAWLTVYHHFSRTRLHVVVHPYLPSLIGLDHLRLAVLFTVGETRCIQQRSALPRIPTNVCVYQAHALAAIMIAAQTPHQNPLANVHIHMHHQLPQEDLSPRIPKRTLLLHLLVCISQLASWKHMHTY